MTEKELKRLARAPINQLIGNLHWDMVILLV